jgi:hypothetical protein
MSQRRSATMQGIELIAQSRRAVRRSQALLAAGLVAFGLLGCEGGTAHSATPGTDSSVTGQGGAGGIGGQGGAGGIGGQGGVGGAGGEAPIAVPDAGPVPDAGRPPVMPATEPGHGLPEPEDRAVEVGEDTAADLVRPDVPPPPVVVEIPGRARRRMNLDQLNASIRQVTGGVGWTERRNNVEIDLFEELSATLGKPDYVQSTHEDLEPSALFQKFLDDAARSVCAATVAADRVRPEADRALMRFIAPDADPATERAATTANLQYVLRRFHGRNLRLDDGNLEAWRWQLEATVFSRVAPADAWGAICVALLTHPHFYTY